MSVKQWTCFHCDETFTDVDAAREHFGADAGATPGCWPKVSGDAKTMLTALRESEREVGALRNANETLDYDSQRLSALSLELEGLFGPGCTSPRAAWDVLDSLTGEKLVLEARVAELEAQHVWQSIVSAPKDRMVLIYGVDNGHEYMAYAKHQVYLDGSEGWYCHGGSFISNGGGWVSSFKPSLWRELQFPKFTTHGQVA